MIYHIVTGDIAAAPLREAITADSAMEGEVVIMKDVLSVGPLQKEEGQKFSEMRSAFWQQVAPNEKNPIQVDDLERLLETGNELSKNEDAKIWLWQAPGPADIATYHWSLKYLGKYIGRLYVVNIGEIQPKELIKAKRLARLVTPSELETDAEEWRKLQAENAGIRIHEGGKRLISKSEEHYDNQLISFCSHQYQKASKIVNQAIARYNIPTGDIYLGWRLRKMTDAGRLELQGDITKGLKDFDVKMPGDGTNAQYSLPL